MHSPLRLLALASALAATLLAGRAGADSAVDAAEKLLASKDWSERLKGLGQLAEIGRKSSAAEKAALPLLEDEDWAVEIAACRTLAKVGGDPSKEALSRHALDAEIQWVRDAAIEALRALDPDAGVRILDRARGAGSKEDLSRARAYVAAGRLGGKEVLSRLAARLASKDEVIQAAAMRGIAETARDPSLAKEVIAAVEPHLDTRAEKKTFFVYAAALEALGRVPGPEAANLLAEELVRAPDDDLYAQERIARGLESRPAAEVTGALHAARLLSKKTDDLRRIARIAGRVRCAGARDDVAALLDHKEERVRSEAAKALGLLHEAALAPALTKALDDKSPYVRLEALTALARTVPAAEFRALGATLRKDPIEQVRLQFVVEVADHGAPEGIAELTPFLADGSWRVATAAAAAIGTLGVAEDQGKLEPLLAHKSWQMRAAAFEGMGRLRAAKAIPLLTEGLLDKDPVTRGVCLANLQILTREKLGPDPKPWREWWAKNANTVTLVKKSRRSEAEKKKDEERNKEYANQPKTFNQGVEILQKARILVVTGAWDHVERVLAHLAIPFTLLRAQELKEAGINPNQVILVNCEGNMDKDSRERVQWFVNVGGSLMTTDWALTKTVEPGFPGHLKQFAGSSTGNDVVVVEQANLTHPYLAGIFDNVPALKWWLEVQAFPMTVTYPERTEVLVDSAEMRQRYGSSPMAAVFRWGLGRVQHSISHFYLQEEGMQQQQRPRDRMIFAADNLGLTLDEIRRLAKEGGFEGQLNDETMKKIAPGYSMFRLIVNVVREKSDWVENL